MKKKIYKKVRKQKRVKEIRLTPSVTLKSLLSLSYERPYNVREADDDLRF